jgi:hypothetical protein
MTILPSLRDFNAPLAVRDLVARITLDVLLAPAVTHMALDMLHDEAFVREVLQERASVPVFEHLALAKQQPPEVRTLSRFFIVKARGLALHHGDWQRIAPELASRASAIDLTPDAPTRTAGSLRDAWGEAAAQAVAFTLDADDWKSAARREAVRDALASRAPLLDTVHGGRRLVVPREVAFSELGIDAPPFGDVDDEDDANERLAVLFAQASAAERRALVEALGCFERGEPLPPKVRMALSRLRKRVSGYA